MPSIAEVSACCSVHQGQIIPVTLLLHPIARHEPQGGGVHAVALPSAVGRSIVEDVSQMDAGLCRPHLDPGPTQQLVVLAVDQQSGIDGLGECGPAAARVVFVSRGEERLPADHVHIDARAKLPVVGVGEGPLGGRVLGDLVAFRVQGPDAFDVALPGGGVGDGLQWDVAVSAGVLEQVVLVGLLRRIEVDQGLHLHSGMTAGPALQFLQGAPEDGLLLLAMLGVPVETAPILPAPVVALPIHREGVDHIQQKQGQGPQTDRPGIIGQPHALHGIGDSAADLFIAGVGHCGLGVSHLGVDDPVHLLEEPLDAPEASPRQDDRGRVVG